MKIYYILIFMLYIINISLNAQNITIFGKVVESKNNTPIEFATIFIGDTETKKPITGMTTDAKGQFSTTTKVLEFYIEVNFIGFATQKITNYSIENNHVDLGIIAMSEDAALLDEIVVQSEKSTTIFKLDKRVFNVGTDISSTGASALEVLNNVPSVNVNIEGQISLRGSYGVQILINGKPSVSGGTEGNLLGTITADMIEKIEVITNPSAKYEASGTSGIINIVLKKSEKKGLNGSITLNTGIPNNQSVGLSLNRRTEYFNLFSQIGHGHRTFPTESETSNFNKTTKTNLSAIGKSNKNETFFNIILGTDYHINDLNVMTLSGHYAFEDEKENADQKYSYRFTDNPYTIPDGWNRNELTTASNPKWEYELHYKKDFKSNKDRSLLFSALGSSFSKDKISKFTNTTSIGYKTNSLQEAYTNFAQNQYTFKLDYTHPFPKKYALETGAQYVIDDVHNDYQVRDFISNTWQTAAAFSNLFNYNQGVLGLYGTYAYKGYKWGVKGGLRMESNALKTELQNTGERSSQNYTNLFPSLHASYKINDDVSLQVGYSKRIFRPSLWSLNPFVSFRDNFNLSMGNPKLYPEFTNSFEATSIFNMRDGLVNLSVYHRITNDVIERITTFENNVTTSRPDNVGTNNATGVELNAKYSPEKWITFAADFNYNTFVRKGQFDKTNFDFTGNRWTSKLIAKLKLPANFTIETTGNYRSKYKNVQSEVADNFFINVGIRKKIMNGKLNANISVRDVFASRRQHSITDQVSFYKSSDFQRGSFVIFGLSFGFGKGEAMEFSGQKRF